MWVGFPILVFFGNGAWPRIRLHFFFCQHAHKSGSVCGFLSIRCAGSLPKKQHWWPIKISTFFPASAAALVATGFFFAPVIICFSLPGLNFPLTRKTTPNEMKMPLRKRSGDERAAISRTALGIFYCFELFLLRVLTYGKIRLFLAAAAGPICPSKTKKKKMSEFLFKSHRSLLLLARKAADRRGGRRRYEIHISQTNSTLSSKKRKIHPRRQRVFLREKE